MHVQEWLDTVPPGAVYAVVALVIGLESLGIPLPGEIVLVSAALMSSQHAHINPVVLGVCATVGAVVATSVGSTAAGGAASWERLGGSPGPEPPTSAATAAASDTTTMNAALRERPSGTHAGKRN